MEAYGSTLDTGDDDDKPKPMTRKENKKSKGKDNQTPAVLRNL